MVRYELILHRAPKLRVSDLEQRMGDLPDELSLGSLQRAIEQPEEVGSLAIAWGDNRKRLLTIQRRIAILGGDASLVDRAGPMRQQLTAWGDALFGSFRNDDPRAAHSGKGGLSLGAMLWIGALSVAVIAALVWRFGDRLPLPPWVRPRALQLSAFGSGVVLSQLLVHGVRAWLQDQGRRWIAALCVLVSLSSLGAASYQARELGLWQRATQLKSQLTHEQQRKPTMKPFTAMMVELERRHQRRELSAALDRTAPAGQAPAVPASATAPDAVSSAPPQPTAAEHPSAPNPSAPEPSMQSQSAKAPSIVSTPHVARELAREPSERSARATTNQGGIAGVPALTAMRGERIARTGHAEPAGPWRTVSDVNPIHGAAAMVLAVATFALGFWLGRRRVAPSAKPQAPAVESAPQVVAPPPLTAAAPKSLPPLEPVLMPDDTQPMPANDTSSAIAAASAQRLSTEGTRGRRAVNAGFSIQEARVAPRKRDARSDD